MTKYMLVAILFSALGCSAAPERFDRTMPQAMAPVERRVGYDDEMLAIKASLGLMTAMLEVESQHEQEKAMEASEAATAK